MSGPGAGAGGPLVDVVYDPGVWCRVPDFPGDGWPDAGTWAREVGAAACAEEGVSDPALLTATVADLTGFATAWPELLGADLLLLHWPSVNRPPQPLSISYAAPAGPPPGPGPSLLHRLAGADTAASTEVVSVTDVLAPGIGHGVRVVRHVRVGGRTAGRLGYAWHLAGERYLRADFVALSPQTLEAALPDVDAVVATVRLVD